MTLPIEDGIPLPRRGRGGRTETIGNQVPWRDLQVGQSVLIPRAITSQYTNPAGVITGAAYFYRIRVSLRTQDDGIRIWRTA